MPSFNDNNNCDDDDDDKTNKTRRRSFSLKMVLIGFVQKRKQLLPRNKRNSLKPYFGYGLLKMHVLPPMQSSSKKRNFLQEKRVQFPQNFSGTPK